MKPGRDLDALVAEKVMGLRVEWRPYHWFSGSIPSADWYPITEDGSCPHYSTDIAAAWQVVEKLRGVWDIKSMSDVWLVRLSTNTSGWNEKVVGAEALTAPHAICLAALNAVGVRVLE